MDIDLAVLRGVERERDISLDVLFPAIEQALLLAYQRTDGSYRNARAELDRKTGHVTIWAREEFEVPVEDEPPAGLPLLGLYSGVPLTRRTSWYGAVPPDKITIYQGPLERHFGHSDELLRRQVRRVVVHEIAHHFGIDDERHGGFAQQPLQHGAAGGILAQAGANGNGLVGF